MIAELNELPGQQTVLTLDAPKFRFGTLIPSLTPHRVVLGDFHMTPFYAEKARLLGGLLERGETTVLERCNVGWMVTQTPRHDQEAMARVIAHFEMYYANKGYALYQRKGASAEGEQK